MEKETSLLSSFKNALDALNDAQLAEIINKVDGIQAVGPTAQQYMASFEDNFASFPLKQENTTSKRVIIVQAIKPVKKLKFDDTVLPGSIASNINFSKAA